MEKNTHHPTTLQEAIQYFSNPDTCLQYMIPLRWADGIVVCPTCESKEHSFLSTRRLWKCKTCKKQFSVKQGTVMEDSPLGLDKWLMAVWLIANAKNGISSYEIHRAIGITQKSAWFLSHRIRLAMQTGTFLKLSGQVEVDETFVGGLAKNMHKDKKEARIHGRGGVGKTIVRGLIERSEEKGKSQVTALVVPDRSAETLQDKVRENVAKGSEVITDELASYRGLAEDYTHNVINHSNEEYVRGHIHTNSMENFWTLFKRCIKGTHVSIEDNHTFRYLDEEMFRFNERKNKDGDRFVKAVSGISGRRLTYKQLTNNGGKAFGRRGKMRKSHEQEQTESE